jgi:predicted kinase
MIYLTVGVPASGKSTWAKQTGYARVSRDDIRMMLAQKQILDGKGEAFVSKLVETCIANKGKQDMVVDQTNCNLYNFKKLLDFCRSYDDVTIVTFEVDIEEAVKRDAARALSVGRAVIMRMGDGLVAVTEYLKANGKEYKKGGGIAAAKAVKDSRDSAVVFDIDGTLATKGNRGYYDWHKVGVDTPNKAVVAALNAFKASGHKIVVVTGRDGICFHETSQWLKDNDIHFDELFIRPVNDMRKDYVIKREIYEQFIEPDYNVVGVFDDRKQVKRMWVEIGLYVFDCNQTDEEF